jgi:ABC-type antimicrobial peptide transport system permease subunit
MFVVARGDRDAAALAAPIREVIARLDPTVPVADVASMEHRVARSMSRARTSLMLAAALAGLALTLGLVGLYGVLSFGVAQRFREFGVRLAVGATPGAVRRLILREGLRLTLAGTAIGAAGAALVVNLIRTVLYGTSASDVRQYAVGIAIVLAFSSAAFWLPARRASSTDPLTALRRD